LERIGMLERIRPYTTAIFRVLIVLCGIIIWAVPTIIEVYSYKAANDYIYESAILGNCTVISKLWQDTYQVNGTFGHVNMITRSNLSPDDIVSCFKYNGIVYQKLPLHKVPIVPIIIFALIIFIVVFRLQLGL